MNRIHIKFSHEFRQRLSEKLMDLGNIVAGALVFAPFLSDNNFSSNLFLIGIMVTFIFYIVSYIVSK